MQNFERRRNEYLLRTSCYRSDFRPGASLHEEEALKNSGVGEQRSSYGTRSITALMESATLWKVDATEAALRAEAGLDRFP